MIFLGFLIPLFGYSLVYSRMLNIKAGPDGPQTGILECLQPSFDPSQRIKDIATFKQSDTTEPEPNIFITPTQPTPSPNNPNGAYPTPQPQLKKTP